MRPFDIATGKGFAQVAQRLITIGAQYGAVDADAILPHRQTVCDRAALRSYHWIPCTAHILNTVLRHTFCEKNAAECIKDVVEMLDTCKSLVTFLKKTGAVASLAHTVIQECEVRWKSKVNMLDEKDQLHRMEGIYQDQLVHLIEFLTLFKLAITGLEGEKYPTIHTVLLWFHKLKKHCQPKFGDPGYISQLRACASCLLDEKMLLTPTHKMATFLCPRFKSLKMLTPEDRQEVMRQVRAALVNEEHRASQDGGEGTSVTYAAAGQGKFSLTMILFFIK
ncbi:hypothetical protein ABVT39_011668 [Epinephelus coioides]